jgi:hypothetical protein
MRRAGVNDAALVTAAMLVEAGISAVAGVLVFAISLVWVRGVSGPVIPIGIFGVVVALLLHPRVFHALATRFLRRFGYRELPPLRASTLGGLLVFYAGTWVIGGTGVWLLLRSVGAHPTVSTIVFLGGVSAVGAIVAVLAFFAPSGLGAREGSMYGLMLAITSSGAAFSVRWCFVGGEVRAQLRQRPPQPSLLRVRDPGHHLSLELARDRPQELVHARALGRQPQSLDAAVVGIDLALHEPELLGPVDVVRDRRAVHVRMAREDAMRDEALVADRVQDDPDAERASGVCHDILERLAHRLGREDEIAADRLHFVTGITLIRNDLTSYHRRR